MVRRFLRMIYCRGYSMTHLKETLWCSLPQKHNNQCPEDLHSHSFLARTRSSKPSPINFPIPPNSISIWRVSVLTMADQIQSGLSVPVSSALPTGIPNYPFDMSAFSNGYGADANIFLTDDNPLDNILYKITIHFKTQIS